MGRMAAALVVVLAMACGGDGGGGDADAAATTTAVSPAEGSTTTVVPVALPGMLEAGTYRSAAFEPPLELTVEDDRWRLQVDQADVFSLVQADEGDSSVALVRPTGVFPPGGGAQEAVPDDLLSWVGDHPELGAGGAVTEIAVGDDTAACRADRAAGGQRRPRRHRPRSDRPRVRGGPGPRPAPRRRHRCPVADGRGPPGRRVGAAGISARDRGLTRPASPATAGSRPRSSARRSGCRASPCSSGRHR
jgi:hypothetical protein